MISYNVRVKSCAHGSHEEKYRNFYLYGLVQLREIIFDILSRVNLMLVQYFRFYYIFLN